jgi:glycosyltransferase involved in cell wall biosynthesis
MRVPPIEALFVNSGLLGQRTFARFVDRAFDHDPEIRARQVVLTDNLTPVDRIVRRLLCTRLAPNGSSPLRNADLFRYRAELNAGLIARRRIAKLERAGAHFDVLHFHRQGTAYGSLDRMHVTPSIVSIDCTQRLVINRANSALEARTYALNAARDGEIFRAARLIVAASQWAADCLRIDYPDCLTEILVMPNPVQLEFFDETWIEERAARTATEGARPRVLFVGGDLMRKGGDDLLAIWRDAQLGRVACLDLVTSAPIAPALLSEGITVHPGVTVHSPKWVELWRHADLFTMPTRDEAFGIVFQEAAAAGLPSIGTRLNSIPELIADDVTGRLVQPGDRDALAQALMDLIGNAERRRDMGVRARAAVVRTAHPDVYRGRLAAAIRRVARR